MQRSSLWLGALIGFLGAAVIALAVAVIALSGGDDDGDGGQETQPERQVFISDVTGNRSAEPSSLVFSLNGDLEGSELQWQGWGEDQATATGTFTVRQSGGQSTIDLPGTLTVNGRVPCGAESYDSQGSVVLEGTTEQPVIPDFTVPCG